MPIPLQHCQQEFFGGDLKFFSNGFSINMVKRKNAISKYLAEIGRKGGKASGTARMEKLTPEQRVAIAKTAAAARWAKPVTQGDLKRQSASQVAEWTADRVAQM